MMTNRQLLDTALRQSAIDMCCAPEDFLRETPVTVRAQKSDGARKYLPQPAEFSMVSYGHNIVAATAEAYAELAREYAAKVPLEYWLDAPYIHALERALNAHGLSVSRTAEYWLPDLQGLKRCPQFMKRNCSRRQISRSSTGRSGRTRSAKSAGSSMCSASVLMTAAG